MELTRKRVLIEALQMFETRQRAFSRGLSMLEPEPGYEKAWEGEREKANLIRRMIYEIENGQIRDWQAEIMYHPEGQKRMDF